jgi:hypothetical protein
MKKLLAAVFVLSTTMAASCPNNKINWATLIADAQFGVTQACSERYIPETACILITDGLTAASAAIAKDPTMAPAIIHKILTDVEMLLPLNSPGRIFIDWLITDTK